MLKNLVILFLVVVVTILLISKKPGQEIRIQEFEKAISDNIQKKNVDEIENRNNIIDLSGTGLQQLPSHVLLQKNIQELDISNNELTGALPAEIRHLKNLKKKKI